MTKPKADRAQTAQVRAPTPVELLRCQLERRRACTEVAELVDVAKWVEASCDTGHHGYENQRELRKLLFKTQISNAEKNLDTLLWSDDAYEYADDECKGLRSAIADYLKKPLPISDKIDDLIDYVESLR
jgi:hypothetical protein